MGKFYKLVEKEVKGTRLVSLLFLALVLLWHLLLLSRLRVWEEELILGLAWAPGFVLPLWVIGNMYHMLHSEWNTNSIYLILSLPQRGYKILGAKLLANFIDFLLLGVLSMASIWLFFGGRLLDIIYKFNEGVLLGLFAVQGLQIIFFYILTVAIMLVLAQFSYLVGRLVTKFRGLVIGTTIFLGLWLYVRLGAFLSPLFEWLPDMSFTTWYAMDNVVRLGRETVNTAPIAAVIFLTLILFIFGSWLFDNYIEV